MSELIFPAILILLSGFLAGESENILMYRFVPNWKIKPLFDGHWYLIGKHIYSNKLINLIMKCPLAMFKSGFHFTKSLGIILFIIGISLLGLPMFYNVVLGYVVLGIGFNIGYHT